MERKKKSTPRQQARLTLELMRQAIAAELGLPAEKVGNDDDLIRCGIDSIGIMRLANVWRRSGVEIKFAALIQQPNLAAWWELASATSTHQRIDDDSKVDESAPFDLSPMQQAYWIGAREGQVLGSVNAHYYIELDGEGLEPHRLKQAILAVQARHAMLRVRFLPEGRQQIMSDGFWHDLLIHDLTELDPEAVAQALDQLRVSLSQRRFAVDRGEVFDIQLTLLPKGASRLHLNITMLVCDARSFQIILEDLAQLYDDPNRPLAPISYSFQKYLQHKAKRPKDGYEGSKAYWQGCLAHLPRGPLLPLAADPASLQGQKVARRFHWISPEQKRALKQSSRNNGLSLSVVFATAFAETIGAWSAEQRFLINLPLFDREEFDPEVGLLVGDFASVLIIDADVSAELPFSDQAKLLQARLIEHTAHSEYTGVEVLRDLARSHSGDGLMAPVIFTSVIGMGDLFSDNVVRCFGSPAWITSQTPQVWLDHQVIERDGGLLLNIDFVEDLFPAGVIDDLFQAYVDLLGWLSDAPSSWSESVPSLLPPAQAEVRNFANATHEPYADQLLHCGFFEQAAIHPDRMALAWDNDMQMTYGALAKQALSIAAALVARGVVPGDPVAITMSRGPDQIAAVLGVLAAGAAFVPVSVDQPACRRAQIYESAGAKVILTRTAETISLEWPGQAHVMAVETAKEIVALTEPIPVPADSLAYVIFTSGSTGLPKGVEMTHRAAMNTVQDINRRFGVTASDRVLAVSALEFDLAVYDIFGLLSVGAGVVLVEDEDKREARSWLRLAKNWNVTIWNSVPALLEMLLIATESAQARLKLRLALVSGDWVGVDLPRRLAACAPGCKFVALGGATEAAIWSIAYEVDHVDESWRSIPYGFPLRNQKFRIVDGRGRDRPDLVPGELWIGGAGLAAGYRNESVLTAERFVTQNGERWYRTGDLGRYWRDGTIEFLGRSDLQVKIHGHRVELGEVEAALEGHPQVSKAVAFAAENSRGVLAAAVIPSGDDVDQRALKMYTADRLPYYMMPKNIFVIEQMPLTENGKVDRKALVSLMAEQEAAEEYEPPHPGIETSLARLWSGLLGPREVGRHSNFLALGGDSLSATRLLEMIRKQLRVELSLRQFMANLTISELAMAISERSTEVEEGVI